MKKIILVILAIVYFNNMDAQTKSDNQNFIVILKLTEKYKDEKNWDDSANARVMRHFNNLKQMLNEGILYLAGRTEYKESDQRMFGIYIFKATSLENAAHIMNSDPAVANKIMTAEVHPFSLVLMKE